MADFQRLSFLDEPAIAGAEWWQKSVKSDVSRRTTLIALGVGAAAVVGLGAVAIYNAAGDDERTEDRLALDMQRRYGWSFGANGVALAVSEVSQSSAYDGMPQRARLTQLALEPTARLKPFYQAALLEVPSAVPLEQPPADPTPMQPFVEAFVPIEPNDLGPMFRAGRAAAALLGNMAERSALILDMPGAHAVAFAAGAAEAFEPVLVMPNWPHPRGVVRSHQALAALAIFRDFFTDAAMLRDGAKPSAMAAFVLDSDRSRAVSASTNEFDNRYLASLPRAEALRELGVTHVFYTRRQADDADAADLQGRLYEYEAAGLPVRKLLASDFFVRAAAPSNARTVAEPQRAAPLPPAYASMSTPESSFAGLYDATATFRATYFDGPGMAHGSAGAWRARASVEPQRTVGTIPVVLAGSIILGAAMARSTGSWARGSGGGG